MGDCLSYLPCNSYVLCYPCYFCQSCYNCLTCKKKGNRRERLDYLTNCLVSKNHSIVRDPWGLTPVMREIVHFERNNSSDLYRSMLNSVLVDRQTVLPEFYLEDCLYLAVENRNIIAAEVILQIEGLDLDHQIEAHQKKTILDEARRLNFMTDELTRYQERLKRKKEELKAEQRRNEERRMSVMLEEWETISNSSEILVGTDRVSEVDQPAESSQQNRVDVNQFLEKHGIRGRRQRRLSLVLTSIALAGIGSNLGNQADNGKNGKEAEEKDDKE